MFYVFDIFFFVLIDFCFFIICVWFFFFFKQKTAYGMRISDWSSDVCSSDLGQVVGTIMSGLLIGILLARSVAGVLSGLGGWSTVYKVAAVLMVVMAVALWRSLPSDSADRPKASYRATLASVGKLAATLPRLRTRSAMGGLAFAAVSTVFTTMAFLLSGEFGYSDTQIGLVGLLGVAGALMATVAGRLADRGLGQLATGGAIAILLVAWLPFVAGATHVVWFLVAIVLADLALQGVHVSNQNVIYALVPEARSRVNSVYMTTYFVGAAVGSAGGEGGRKMVGCAIVPEVRWRLEACERAIDFVGAGVGWGGG